MEAAAGSSQYDFDQAASFLARNVVDWALLVSGEDGEVVDVFSAEDVERIRGFSELGLPSLGADGDFMVGTAMGTRVDEVQHIVVDSKENGKAPSSILEKSDLGAYARGALYALQQEGKKLTQVVMGTQLPFHVNLLALKLLVRFYAMIYSLLLVYGIIGLISGSECLDSSGLSSSAACDTDAEDLTVLTTVVH
ncbi:hypothetical protein Syun_011648 [Stephania yunnanensis]|uniref:Uncharacterized protein n=1 Tax=Stephania yunnanensis TaxID=152371 RepID=A0AAP0JZ54_9MAGN